MKSSRKGLKRVGMRCYSVTGPRGTWIIERDRPWRFAVRKEGWPRAPGGRGKLQSMFFQVEPFKRLRDARAYAEQCAGRFPRRLQRRRVKGFHLPPGTICVTRPTRDGNPFKAGDERIAADGTVYRLTPKQAKEEFRAWITAPEQRERLEDAKRRLRGHDLACFCPLSADCHADVWIELVNS